LSNLLHPSALNPLKQYQQACSILKTTGRAKNPAWYQAALDQTLQLHIRTDGMSIATIYYDRTNLQWAQGPYLTEEILRDPSRRDAFVSETLEQARQSGASSLGVILHVGDDFATTELKSQFKDSNALTELRTSAFDDPASVLADSSIQADQASWRVFPYPAAKSESVGTAVTMTRQYAPLMESFRKAGESAKFPIISEALSAPLVAIMGLGHSIKPSPGKPYIAILQYPWLTALAFFDEQSELRLIRSLQHRGLRRPNNFVNSLATAQTSLEFVDPDLFVVPLGGKVDITLIADLKAAYNNSRVEEVQQIQVEGIPSWCPEPVISVQASSADSATVNSKTFSLLRDDKWALQNFLPTPKAIAQIYPSLSEIKLLKFSKIARAAAFILGGLGIAYFGYNSIRLRSRPEWSFNPNQAASADAQLAKLNLEKQQADHWDNLLQDRSKAWTVMESLSRLFPKDSGILVDDFSHTAGPVKAAGAVVSSKTGLSKQWKISGYANLKGRDKLQSWDSRGGINPIFREIAEITGNSSFSSDVAGRIISVSLKTQESTASNSATYPYSFDLTITQTYDVADPMAITLSKAP
jgi:hypothetical protein